MQTSRAPTQRLAGTNPKPTQSSQLNTPSSRSFVLSAISLYHFPYFYSHFFYTRCAHRPYSGPSSSVDGVVVGSAGPEALDGTTVDIIKPQVDLFVFPVAHDVIVLAGAATGSCWPSVFRDVVFLHGPGSDAACLLRNLTRTKAYKNDFQLLPRQLAEKVATLHLIVLGAVRTIFPQEHADYLGVKVEGTFKGQHYRY